MKRFWSKSALLLLAGLLAGLASTACGSDATTDTGKVSVVATFYPLAYLAERVGGERVSVKNLVPAGVEPHDWEPTPRDITTINKSKVFVYQGLGFELWAKHAIEELPAVGPVVVNATEGLVLKTGPHGASGFDPHVWLDPQLFAEQSMLIYAALLKADPAGEAVYAANLSALTADFQRLTAEMQKGLGACQRTTFVTSHAAFAYLADRLNLEQVAVTGLSPDAEPSPQRLRDVIQQVRASGATHIFFETLVSPAIAETIARETGAKTLVLNPIEGLTNNESKAGASYFTLQRENLANLKVALGCV